jgi:hypothetical protein
VESVRATKQDQPCVSIYFNKPSGRDPDFLPSIAFYRELAYARDLLEKSFSRQRAAEYLKPLLQVAKEEFVSDAPSTLGLFHSGDISSFVRLDEFVPSGTIVADSFHLKPLMKQEQKKEAQSLAKGLVLCRRAMSEGRVVTSLYEVAQALRSEKAHCLWVAEDVKVWGMLSRANGIIVLHPRQLNERDGDVLDDLAEWALDLGIDVQVLPRHQIPGQHLVIAEV